MSGTYARLLALDPAALQTAADSWRKLAKACGTAQQQHAGRVRSPLVDHWKGHSGQEAIAVLREVADQLTAGEIDALAMANILSEAHTDLASARNSLRAAVREAEAAGLTVGDDGVVSPPAWMASEARQDPGQYTRDTHTLGEYQHLIDTAISNAEAADRTACSALSAMDPHQLSDFNASGEASTSLDRVDKGLGITTAGLPDGKNPKQNADWWKALSPDEQQAYLVEHPRMIGRMDGLPATARDQANRLYLQECLNGGFGVPSNEGVSWAGARLQAAQSLQDKLDAPAQPGKELYLLGFDPNGEAGKAIVAMGNPDTARNTAILVPGTDTNLGNMPGQITRIGHLYDESHSQASGKSLSVISWLDYNAPQDLADGHLDKGVASTSRAEEGAPALRRFVAGTRTAQGSLHSHITVLGHSYGTTTVGAAAAGSRHGLGADDIVLVASPGATVDYAKDLNIDPAHVFTEAVPDDAIRHAAGWTLGYNPAMVGFGATRLATDTHGHSGYWDTGSTSLSNQAAIITGNPYTTTAPEQPPSPPRMH